MRTILVLSAMVATVFASPQKRDRTDVQFEAAAKKETVDGDLKAAIEIYQKIAQSGNRVAAANALVRMGQCYEKLGDTEAKKAYERVVREFGDQKEAVAEARKRLTKFTGPGGALNRQPGLFGPVGERRETRFPRTAATSPIRTGRRATSRYTTSSPAPTAFWPLEVGSAEKQHSQTVRRFQGMGSRSRIHGRMSVAAVSFGSSTSVAMPTHADCSKVGISNQRHGRQTESGSPRA